MGKSVMTVKRRVESEMKYPRIPVYLLVAAKSQSVSFYRRAMIRIRANADAILYKLTETASN